MSWPVLQAAFASPNRTDTARYEGFDLTKPYPGSALAGFSANLRIADDVPFPSEVTTEKVMTNVAAITFDMPLSKAMDPSWYVCQHFFVSTLPDPTKDIDHDCSFLPEQCQTDLVNSLVDPWGSFKDDSSNMCGGWTFDYITPSCQDALGHITSDVYGWDHSTLEDAIDKRTLTVDEVGQYSWMMGTGFHDPPNAEWYYQRAYNRTYITVNVFGYNSQVSVSGASKPFAKLSCLRANRNASPDSGTSTTSPTDTGSTTTPGTVTSSLSSPTTNPSTTAPGSGTTSTGSAASATSASTSSASPTSTAHCLGIFVLSLVISCLTSKGVR
ncbi:hypothetical protein DL546_006892 [Coniochaeta pulveracea]|nr:hypothetical protein DL546_006892 [Coniochaeta pulveracea]